jgi:hypothetical protein
MNRARLYTEELQRRENDRLLYLIRLLIIRVHNALCKNNSDKIKDPTKIIQLSMDPKKSLTASDRKRIINDVKNRAKKLGLL